MKPICKNPVGCVVNYGRGVEGKGYHTWTYAVYTAINQGSKTGWIQKVKFKDGHWLIKPTKRRFPVAW